MDQETSQEIWAELCFHLSDNVSPSINEAIFEQRVLLALEKLLGWSQYKGEIKVKPSLQIGRQNFITPDIVLYTPKNKAAIVLEVKRPAEDLAMPGSVGQLQSYMRQTKADFGFLIGKEIRIYYDGTVNPHADPLLLSKIRFISDSLDGMHFVELFHRDSFIAREYESYLKAHIDRLEQERKVNAVKERLQSEETSQRLLKLIEQDFTDLEPKVLTEAMEGLKIKISYGKTHQGIKTISPPTAESNEMQDFISVCKNKHSGDYFIYIDVLKDNKIHLIKPDGRQIYQDANLFEEPKDESVDYLLSYKLISETQLKKYQQYMSSQPEDPDTEVDPDSGKAKTRKKPSSSASSIRRKNPSPSAFEWSRSVPELSRMSGRITWRVICDYLKVHVGANSGRRVLKEWARINRRGWPEIPEPKFRAKEG